MKTIPTLTLAAMKMFYRNRQALFFTLLFPVILMGIFALVGFDKPMKITIGVVASNPSSATKQFLTQLERVSVFTIKRGTDADERAALKKGDLSLIVFIPDNLIPQGKPTGTPVHVTVLTNIAQPQQAGAAVSILSEILDKTTLAIAKTPQLFVLDVQEVATKNQKYLDFLLPGIVAMSIMQMAVFSVSFVFVEYKEKGILKRLLATPMRPYQFVTANVVTRLLVALLQSTVLVLLGVWAFHAHVFGSPFVIMLLAMLGGIMFLGLGFIISGVAKTEESVPAFANIVVLPMMFLSGIFFPTSAMPDWLQHIVQYFPLSYFAHALREVMANGASLGAVSYDVFWMLAWTAVLVGLAMLTFGFEEKRM